MKVEYLKISETSYILNKTLFLYAIFGKCGSNDEKMFKEEESIEILKILGLINNSI